MKAMRFFAVARFARHERGNFTLAASLVAVPIIMGLALAVDFSRIDHATRSASSSLFTAVRSALSPDGDLDAAVEQALGPVDILVNNAGWDVVKPFLDSDAEHWKKLIDINLYGPLNMHHAVLPGMVENGKGRVVNIASDAGRVGSSGESVYAACKGGIIAFTKTVARELARKGIQLNAVAPGPTDTPLLAQFAQGDTGAKIAEGLKRAIPMKRLGQPSDYPGIICFLASDDAGFITGQVISVSGGLSMHG